MTGTDHGEYKILAYVHDRKLYHTSEELRVAWERGELKRSMPEPYDWATRSIQGNRRDLDDRAGPRTVQFDGARYRLDEEEQYISWMGWAFYTSFERDMGLHLWDM
jgi:primary-amine oxidase